MLPPHGKPTIQVDSEMDYLSQVREQRLAAPKIWHSGIYGLHRVYAFADSLVEKIQDSLLIKLIAGMMNHMPQGLRISQQSSQQTPCLDAAAPGSSFPQPPSVTQQGSPRRETGKLGEDEQLHDQPDGTLSLLGNTEGKMYSLVGTYSDMLSYCQWKQ